MSSVVISGDTSGAITLSAPAVAGTNTLTLPASTGTVLTTGNPQSGGVIQVVYGTGNTSTTFSSTSYATTGIAASITPKFSTSKILVTISVPLCVTSVGAYGAGLAIYRGGSAVYTDTNAYDAGYSSSNPSLSNNVFRWGRVVLQYLDSPATTSSTTYTVYAAAYTGTILSCIGAAIGTITLLEVAA